MTTIKDVAQQADVSVATVSRVINRNGYANEGTRQKVEAAVQLLNYKPNSVARSLFKKQSKTIGIIVPDITNPYFPALVRGVEDYLVQKGYTTILCNSDEDPEKERLYLDVMKQKYVDGVIVVSNMFDRKVFDEYEIPMVALDRYVHQEIPAFVVDNRNGGKVATQHLLDIGCRRIAHLKGPDRIINAEERYEGYIETAQKHDWFCEEYVIRGNFDQKQAAQATRELLTEHPEIDGIFAGNDIMALGVLKGAESLNLKVPDDLAVIGFDNIELTEMATPELSTISQPIYQMSQSAVESLITLIEGKDIKQRENYFPFELIQRQSTRK